MTQPPDREVAVFSAARRLPAPERAAYLDEACAGDAALRGRVQQLLEASEEAGAFLEDPAQGAERGREGSGQPNSGATLRITVAPSEKPGDRIGRYKLLQQIGEGGCGVVYMAEQEEPVRRRVALKVIKLGMDTKQVIARFEAERQALALMDHPNIAKVFDAGSTERPLTRPADTLSLVGGEGRGEGDAGHPRPSDGRGAGGEGISAGRPYFVMELVRGVKITDFCDENKLSTADRLKLFIQVCQAIQHAHQKGVIHRDIKPSNILVTINDGVPVPKVIDFGIAKATQGRLTDQTLFTAFEQFIGTPAYMSPEQAVMTSLDIDTRSDIYSLGVLLYELLTGRTPFDQKELLAAGLDEMRRTIREKEPLRPSTRLSTMAADALTATANERHTDAPKLIHLLRGDLDWIVMKSLEKDRARRYETANGVARDITRHLNCEPVLARPPSRLYEFQKTVRRHKFGFAAGAALITILAVGVMVSTLEAVRARTEAAKAAAVSDFLQQMLRSADPDAHKGSEYTVRQLLDDVSSGLTNQFRNQPEVEAEVRVTLGRAYHSLELFDKSQTHLDRALMLRRRIFGENEQVADTLEDCAFTSAAQGQFARGEAQAREALEIYRKRGTTGRPVISSLRALQLNLIGEGRTADAEAITDEARVMARKSPGVEFPELATMIHWLADMKVGQARYAEGAALAREAVAMERRQRQESYQMPWALFILGKALIGERKFDEAERALREALEIFRKQNPHGDKGVDMTTGYLKTVLEAKGDSAGLAALLKGQTNSAAEKKNQPH